MVKISTRLPSPFSKTGRLRRSLIVRVKRSAKTAPNDVFCRLVFIVIVMY